MTDRKYGHHNDILASKPLLRPARRQFLSGAIAALAAGVVGGRSARAASLPGIDMANKVVRVGAFSPLTGPVPFYAAIQHAADAYFKDLNERGGIRGWKVQYIIRDDGYDPAQSLAATRRLVEEDDVYALVVSNGTTPNIAIIPYARSKNLPVIARAAGRPRSSPRRTCFRCCPTTPSRRHRVRNMPSTFSARTNVR